MKSKGVEMLPVHKYIILGVYVLKVCNNMSCQWAVDNNLNPFPMKLGKERINQYLAAKLLK